MCSFNTFDLFCTVSSLYQPLNSHFSLKVKERCANVSRLTQVQFQAVMLAGSASLGGMKAY